VLQRLLFALIKGQETLCATLGRLGRDVVHGAEGANSCVLRAKRLAQTQRDLRLGGRTGVIGEREGVPALGQPGELAD
jgi:hypothetical protein